MLANKAEALPRTADEVRQLAQKTQDSTVSIQQMISNLQSGSDRAASSMQETLDKAQASADNVVKAGELLVQMPMASPASAIATSRWLRPPRSKAWCRKKSTVTSTTSMTWSSRSVQPPNRPPSTAVELASLADHQQQLVCGFKVG